MRVIFDLDGTLANIEHRVHLITNEDSKDNDWDKFYRLCTDDKPIVPLIDLCSKMVEDAGFFVEIWTGRSDSVRKSTIKWLEHHAIRVNDHPEHPDYPPEHRIQKNFYYAILRMRQDGDYRPDHEIKEEWLSEPSATGLQPALVFEDRSSVVNMWRKHGILCCQVAEGNF